MTPFSVSKLRRVPSETTQDEPSQVQQALHPHRRQQQRPSQELQPAADARRNPAVIYYVPTYHWFVHYNLVWSEWTSFWDDDVYYDVWADGV